MKFREALLLTQEPVADGAEELSLDLACGFTPDQFRTFLAAYLRTVKTDRRIDVRVGLFGDLIGNLERVAATGGTNAVIAVIEWSDLDDRLGLRRVGGWLPASLEDIVSTVESKLSRVIAAIDRIAASRVVAISLPTLPLPPVSFLPPHQAGLFETRLKAAVADAGVRLAGNDHTKLLNAQALDVVSPLAERLDVRSELNFGYPYLVGHASKLAKLLVTLVDPPAPKKGLITDLDDTMWRGILGDVGAENVTWDLDHHSQIHALYQQLLTSLARAGVLIAVASKNDAANVERAFQRDDLFFKASDVFPFEVHWGTKSSSVRKILSAWNIAPDSVVFVDDSPLELAEVAAAHPSVTTLRFPKDDAQAYRAIEQLREWFGKPAVSADDAIRLDSLRRGSELTHALAGGDGEAFLASVNAVITMSFEKSAASSRPLELINKTNQFNLNGKRIAESDWLARLSDPRSFVATVGYSDKFGPLGTVAVIVGQQCRGAIVVEHWVMSCRAFSRRIEYATALRLFDYFGAEALVLDFVETAKNGPLQDFLKACLPAGAPLEAGVTITRTQFDSICPKLYHAATELENV